MVNEGLQRNATVIKRYAYIIICFATKDVHIEVVFDLSTRAFIGALN